MMYQLQVIIVGLVLLFCKNLASSSATTYYAIKPFQEVPHYGSIFSYNPQTSTFVFYANFSFHIDDNTTDLYYFVPGPVAIATNNTSSILYIPVECGTSFQRLFLLAFDMKTKNFKQSKWLLKNGGFDYLYYDPLRHRLFGSRDVNTFTLIMEEYNITTLDVIREYTRQDGEKYAFPDASCSIFDYNENWIVQVRTRFESTTVNAYFVKMDLNLVGKKKDIVVEFRLLPNVHSLCTMTYDMKTKLIFATWQYGSIDNNLVMLYMNPYTSEFSNVTLLFETPDLWVVEFIDAIFDEQTRHILFLIQHQNEETFDLKNWMILVEFDTMNVIGKKQVKTIPEFADWEYFILQ
ncbi:unnamed protein product [Rotaria sp. Silwood1]|nr:unnamed protein product [Rotaria sp. Silwood1]CAF3830398.1 unnamed protein product [Rotaria sp. Silwood1]CAF4812284.1 unnamed protein product [Rotaria sp. Silwood1]